MKTRPKGLVYKVYRATCAAKGMTPMDEDAFKALPEEESQGGGTETTPGNDAGGSNASEAGTGGGTGTGGGGGSGGSAGTPGNDAGGGNVEDKFGKGLVGDGALAKAFQGLDDVGKSMRVSRGSREDYLKARLDNGTISKAERQEYGRILAGDDTGGGDATGPTGSPLAKSLRAVIDGGAVDVIDGSPVLKAIFDGLDTRLQGIGVEVGTMSKAVEARLAAQDMALKALIVVADDTMKVNKALMERLNAVERQPAAPRAVVAKSNQGADRGLGQGGSGAGGGQGAGGDLTKPQVLKGLQMIVKGAADEGDDETMQKAMQACAKVEAGHAIDQSWVPAIRHALG